MQIGRAGAPVSHISQAYPDRVEVRGTVRPPPPDDYGAYLARIGAAGTLRADGLEVLPTEDSLARTLEGLRRSADAGGSHRSLRRGCPSHAHDLPQKCCR